MDKVEFKRAKLSGWLDILGFLASLIVTAGYVLVELVKLSSLPEWLTKAWDKIHGGIENIFDGVVLERLVDLPKYPGLPSAARGVRAVVCRALHNGQGERQMVPAGSLRFLLFTNDIKVLRARESVLRF